MDWKLQLYQKLVNQVPGIREKYQIFRERNVNRLAAWGYLLCLNFGFHVLCQKKVGQAQCLRTDQKVRLRTDQSESAQSKRQSPDEFAAFLAQYDVVSFDVFDTLVFRPFQAPQDIFFLLEQRLEYPGLKKIRQTAEQEIRGPENHNEVTLEEIWKRVEQLSGINASIGMKAEMDAELESCRGNPYFLAVAARLKTAGKKTIICSDMYLSRHQIAMLLKKCGYREFDDLFISCEYRASKSEGTLYEIVRQKYGSQLTYIHVGDNRHSDFVQAKKKQFNAYLYESVNKAGQAFRPKDMSPIMASVYSGIVNMHLHNGLIDRTIPYEFGFVYGGLLVTGYCQFIHDYAERNQIERILFFSRDGDIVCKAYQRMYPEQSDRCVYVYWSRLAAVKLSASYYKYHYLECMIDHKINLGYTVHDVLKTMELEDLTEEFCVYSGNDLSGSSVLDRRAGHLLRDFINDNWERVLQRYSAEVKAGGEYFKRVLNGVKKAVCVDVGWSGTGAVSLRYLSRYVWQLDCELTGLIAGTTSGLSSDRERNEAEIAAGHLVSYLFSSGHNRDIWKIHDAAKDHNLAVELILSSPSPSFRGFSEQGLLFNKKTERVDSRAIQRGILDFVGLFMEHPLADMTVYGRDAAAPIAILYQNESYIQKIIRDSEIQANIE